jgi:hypothetical protein
MQLVALVRLMTRNEGRQEMDANIAGNPGGTKDKTGSRIARGLLGMAMAAPLVLSGCLAAEDVETDDGPTDGPGDGPGDGPTDGPDDGPTDGPDDGPTEDPFLNDITNQWSVVGENGHTFFFQTKEKGEVQSAAFTGDESRLDADSVPLYGEFADREISFTSERIDGDVMFSGRFLDKETMEVSSSDGTELTIRKGSVPFLVDISYLWNVVGEDGYSFQFVAQSEGRVEIASFTGTESRPGQKPAPLSGDLSGGFLQFTSQRIDGELSFTGFLLDEQRMRLLAPVGMNLALQRVVE